MTKISHISWGGYEKGFYGNHNCFDNWYKSIRVWSVAIGYTKKSNVSSIVVRNMTSI